METFLTIASKENIIEAIAATRTAEAMRDIINVIAERVNNDDFGNGQTDKLRSVLYAAKRIYKSRY